MQALNTDDRQIKFYYDSSNLSERGTLANIKSLDITIDEYDLSKEQLTATQLSTLADLMESGIKDLVDPRRVKDEEYEKIMKMTDEEVLKLLKNDSKILETPIVVRGNVCRKVKTKRDFQDLDWGKNSSFSDKFQQ